MKKDIHPKYYPKANVRCACGNTFTVGSAKEFIETEVCAKCHPFYTKQEKVMDTLGRVQKFKERLTKKSATVKRVKNPRAPKGSPKEVK
jgi:large subunit ribosomal protein L31